MNPPPLHKGAGWGFSKMAVLGERKSFTRNGREGQEWGGGGGGAFIVGGTNFLKSSYIVGREVLTPTIEDPPILPTSPFQILSNLPLLPCPTVLSVLQFHWLNGWSCCIWCGILLNDNMDLLMSNLSNVVPEGPSFVFYATRCKVYWGLTHNMVFYW